MNNQWHTLFGFRILLGVFALTWQACRVFQLLHGHSKLASSYTADRCRFKPSANHSCANSSHNATSTPPLPPPYPASAAFLQFCVVLFCFGLFWLLFLVTVSFFQILFLGRRVSNFQIFTVTFSTCRHDLHVPHAAAFQVLPDQRTQQTCYSWEEFIKQVGLGACMLTMHYDVRPPQLRVSSSCSHVPRKSVASVNVARKPRRIKQVAASITPHHFPPQHQLRRQL